MKKKIILSFILCSHLLLSCVSTKVIDYVPIENKIISTESDNFYKLSIDSSIVYVRVMKVDIITERIKSYITIKIKDDKVSKSNITITSTNYGDILRLDKKKFQKEITSRNIRDTIEIKSDDHNYIFIEKKTL